MATISPRQDYGFEREMFLSGKEIRTALARWHITAATPSCMR
ncbi:hypothetical protein [Paracidovorax anthurii]|nr:hypothetical protein [Paracidovorax anthurii]